LLTTRHKHVLDSTDDTCYPESLNKRIHMRSSANPWACSVKGVTHAKHSEHRCLSRHEKPIPTMRSVEYPGDARENSSYQTMPQIGRRSFLKKLSFLLAAPVLPFSCGKLPDPTDKSTINSLLLHLLGIEAYPINLFDQVRQFADESFDQACLELLEHIAGRYQTSSGMDLKAFLDDLNAGALWDEDDVFYLIEILRTNAIMVFYASPLGFALADYERQPFKRTFIHSFIRDRTYPNCYTPCHSSYTCYAACHPAKGAGRDLKISREMPGDGDR
jgi:hypothetical protein